MRSVKVLRPFAQGPGSHERKPPLPLFLPRQPAGPTCPSTCQSHLNPAATRPGHKKRWASTWGGGRLALPHAPRARSPGRRGAFRGLSPQALPPGRGMGKGRKRIASRTRASTLELASCLASGAELVLWCCDRSPYADAHPLKRPSRYSRKARKRDPTRDARFPGTRVASHGP